MKFSLPRLVSLLLLLFSGQQLFSQASACPQVNAGPDQTICGGCTNLNATVQGTAGTSTYTVSSIPYNPYPFTGGNPVLVNIDDTWSSTINMPFCFDFFGNTYNQLVIGSNALVTFDLTVVNGYCDWVIGNAIPTPALQTNSIMAPYHDIDPSVGTPTSGTDVNWAVYGTAPCRQFVINWYDVALFSCNNLIATSQLVLHESTNIIDIYIADKPTCSTWNGGAAIEGIQNATGTTAYVVPGRNFPTQWNATNDGWRFMPSGPPNYTIQWLDQNGNVIGNNTSVQVCPTQTTTYTAQVTNTSCSGPIVVSDQVVVNVTPGNMTVTPSSVNPLCGQCNGSATATPSGGTPPYTYSWAPSGGTGQTASNLCAGVYTVTVTESGGCQSTATFNLIGAPSIVTQMASTGATCNQSNGTASVNASNGTGPYTYSWSPGGGNTQTINGLAPGMYTVTVTDANGCQTIDSVLVSSQGPSVTPTQTNATCFGDCNGSASVTVVSGTPPYTYSWAPVGGTNANATGLCAGNYTATITDGAGCVTTQTFAITQPAQLTMTTSGNITICNGSSTTISVTPAGGTGPYTVTWDNGLPNGTSNSVSPTQQTTYNATLTDANGCNTTQSITVDVSPAPVAAFSATQGDCAPSVIQFTDASSGATSYYWDFGDPSSGANNTSTLQHPTHIYALGGSYNVTLTAINAIGCSTTVVINNAVTVFGYPNALTSVANDHVSELDPTAVFTDQTTGGVDCIVYFGDGDSIAGCNLGTFTHVYEQAGTYTIMTVATNANGCTDTSYVTVIVEQETTLYVPNAFTPNGDGSNPFFQAYGSNVQEFQLYVFDRWGVLLFESKDLNKAWDGTFKGEPVQEDVYVWRIIYTDARNKRHKLIGHVTVYR